MYKSVKECMLQPSSVLEVQARKANKEFVTLDTRDKKLTLCQQLSLHQLPMFKPDGSLNPVLQDALEQGEKECNLCSMKPSKPVQSTKPTAKNRRKGK